MILRGHEGGVFDIGFHPTRNDLLLSCGEDRTVRLFYTTQDRSSAFRSHTRRVRRAFFHPSDPKLVISCSDDGSIAVWHVDQKQNICTLQGHEDGVKCAQFSSFEPSTVLSASDDETIRLWDLDKQKEKERIDGFHSNWVTYCCFSQSDPFTFFSCSCDKTAAVWDIRTAKPVMKLEGHSNWVNTVDHSALNGFAVLTSSCDKTAILWDVRQKFPVKRYEGHFYSVYSAFFHPSNPKQFVSASVDDTCRIWDVDKGSCSFILRGHDDTIHSARFNPHESSTIATASNDGTIRLWNLRPERGVLPHRIRKVVNAVMLKHLASEAPHDTEQSISDGGSNGLDVSSVSGAVENGRFFTEIYRLLEEGDRGALAEFDWSSAAIEELDGRDQQGNSLLHIAALNNNCFVIDKLIECGLDPRIKNIAGKDAYTLAREQEQEEAVKALKRYAFAVQMLDILECGNDIEETAQAILCGMKPSNEKLGLVDLTLNVLSKRLLAGRSGEGVVFDPVKSAYVKIKQKRNPVQDISEMQFHLLRIALMLNSSFLCATGGESVVWVEKMILKIKEVVEKNAYIYNRTKEKQGVVEIVLDKAMEGIPLARSLGNLVRTRVTNLAKETRRGNQTTNICNDEVSEKHENSAIGEKIGILVRASEFLETDLFAYGTKAEAIVSKTDVTALVAQLFKATESLLSHCKSSRADVIREVQRKYDYGLNVEKTHICKPWNNYCVAWHKCNSRIGLLDNLVLSAERLIHSDKPVLGEAVKLVEDFELHEATECDIYRPLKKCLASLKGQFERMVQPVTPEPSGVDGKKCVDPLPCALCKRNRPAVSCAPCGHQQMCFNCVKDLLDDTAADKLTKIRFVTIASPNGSLGHRISCPVCGAIVVAMIFNK
uniref:RING-type domain-containing protein n=1 Tax=Palpitomonas bilix TaxID=652834 RepID=A0A7S3FXB9_9EUKA|mmetsp:Transcript_10522/g.27554  ORF Transcript_10522/g.27554 Transcript_10522/m.27554 type:complete len:885 (+) Transcript_10522:415-3069(+)